MRVIYHTLDRITNTFIYDYWFRRLVVKSQGSSHRRRRRCRRRRRRRRRRRLPQSIASGAGQVRHRIDGWMDRSIHRPTVVPNASWQLLLSLFFPRRLSHRGKTPIQDAAINRNADGVCRSCNSESSTFLNSSSSFVTAVLLKREEQSLRPCAVRDFCHRALSRERE